MTDANDLYRPPAAELAEPRAEGPDLAGRGARLLAAMIDGAIGLAVILPALFGAGVFDGFPTPQPLDFGETVGVAGFGLIALVAIHGWLVSKRGQTVGKLVLGIRMVRSDGAALSLGRWIGLRTLPVQVVSLVPVVGNLLAFVDVLAIFRNDRRCLHDLIADTIVVRAR